MSDTRDGHRRPADVAPARHGVPGVCGVGPTARRREELRPSRTPAASGCARPAARVGAARLPHRRSRGVDGAVRGGARRVRRPCWPTSGRAGSTSSTARRAPGAGLPVGVSHERLRDLDARRRELVEALLTATDAGRGRGGLAALLDRARAGLRPGARRRGGRRRRHRRAARRRTRRAPSAVTAATACCCSCRTGSRSRSRPGALVAWGRPATCGRGCSTRCASVEQLLVTAAGRGPRRRAPSAPTTCSSSSCCSATSGWPTRCAAASATCSRHATRPACCARRCVAYLETGSVPETARRELVHPNTVVYRLGRVRDLTGPGPAGARATPRCSSWVWGCRQEEPREGADGGAAADRRARSSTGCARSTRRPRSSTRCRPARPGRRTASSPSACCGWSPCCATSACSRATGSRTFANNTSRHLELYYAVPLAGAVLHMVNIRLHDEQLEYVVADAGDERAVRRRRPGAAARGSATGCRRYAPTSGWARATPRASTGSSRARRCSRRAAPSRSSLLPELARGRRLRHLPHVSGTTGMPKGVVYTPPLRRTCTPWRPARSTASRCPSATGCCRWCRCSTPAAGGCPTPRRSRARSSCSPAADTSPANLARVIATERVTWAAGVPTIWTGLLPLASPGTDLSSLRTIGDRRERRRRARCSRPTTRSASRSCRSGG